MTDKIHLYHPLHTLKPFSDDIWIADGKVIHMNFPLGIKVPFSTRMTVVRLNDGGLWCHSPVEPAPELLRQIDALGEVRHLVSPNKSTTPTSPRGNGITRRRLRGQVPACANGRHRSILPFVSMLTSVPPRRRNGRTIWRKCRLRAAQRWRKPCFSTARAEP